MSSQIYPAGDNADFLQRNVIIPVQSVFLLFCRGYDTVAVPGNLPFFLEAQIGFIFPDADGILDSSQGVEHRYLGHPPPGL